MQMWSKAAPFRWAMPCVFCNKDADLIRITHAETRIGDPVEIALGNNAAPAHSMVKGDTLCRQNASLFLVTAAKA